MNNIKSFEELFPLDYIREKKFIETYFLPDVDQEINDIIDESLGISLDVIHIVNNLVDQIKDCISNDEYEKYSDIDYYSFNDDKAVNKSDTYIINQLFNVDNFVFITECILMNYSNISNDEFDRISTLNIVANVRFISPTKIKLLCFIPTKDFEIDKIGIGVLNHEIMHSWQNYKKNSDGKKEKEYPEWKTLYKNAVDILHKNNNDLISKAIYYSDLRELSSFTQQAYIELKDVDNIESVHNKIKTLEIYKGVKSIKNAIDYLKNNELPKEFSNIISSKTLLSIFQKRYNQYKKNISRLMIARKEIIEENLDYIDISKRELMYINIF